ncbi:MAG TPA: ABC transporter permease, partial [Phenylobacterium sp.]
STAPLLREALRRGLLPAVNQMSAAGVITLPGAMTGQILAGVEPMEAVKYQILLMFLLTGASALAAVVVGFGAMRLLTDDRQRLRLDRLVS